MMRPTGRLAICAVAALACACTSAAHKRASTAAPLLTATSSPSAGSSKPDPTVSAKSSARPAGLPGMPALLAPNDVYAADRPGMLSPQVAKDPAYVYVPDTNSNNVYVIDQQSMRVISKFPGGAEPQHVVPSYDLKTLYVVADKPGFGSITPIDPATGQPGQQIPVDDVYNMYFTPDGQYAIVVQEFYTRLAFYNPHTWVSHDSLRIPSCEGIDHMDFTADGTKLLASCEFANQMVVVDVATHQLLKTVHLYPNTHGMPQDVKLSPDGKVFYVADMKAGGIYLIDAQTFAVLGFQRTGRGAHGLYVSRDSTRMFVTNRDEGSITVMDLATRQPATKWHLPGGGSPDMGNISADGKVLWLSGRYDNVVYAISTADGSLLAKIRVGSGPHGLCVWPIPGRYSLGHTGILR